MAPLTTQSTHHHLAIPSTNHFYRDSMSDLEGLERRRSGRVRKSTHTEAEEDEECIAQLDADLAADDATKVAKEGDKKRATATSDPGNDVREGAGGGGGSQKKQKKKGKKGTDADDDDSDYDVTEEEEEDEGGDEHKKKRSPPAAAASNKNQKKKGPAAASVAGGEKQETTDDGDDPLEDAGDAEVEITSLKAFSTMKYEPTESPYLKGFAPAERACPQGLPLGANLLCFCLCL